MALDTLTGAFRIDPLYQRATIFMALEKPREALAELEKVTFLNGESVKKAWETRGGDASLPYDAGFRSEG